MRLITIADLDQPQSGKAMLIERAMQVGKWYAEFKGQDTGSYKYGVDIGGDRTRAPGVHASEVSKCQRLLVYSILDTERKPVGADQADTNMRMRFSIGHAVHAMIQNELHRMCARFNGAITFRDEVRISPALGGAAAQWGMYSSCDGEFTFWDNQVPYLRMGLEIKTKSGPEFGKMVKPNEDHADQTCLYQKALDLPLMWTFYYNKSNSNWTSSEPPYLFQFDKHRWTTKLEPRIAHSYQIAKQSQQTGVLPGREEGRHCRWCPFAWTCKPPSLLAPRGRGPTRTAHRPGALKVIR